jgi:hypothetical protein
MTETKLQNQITNLYNLNQLKIIYSDNEQIKQLCDNIIGVNQNYLKMIEAILNKMESHYQYISSRIQEEVNKNV